MKKLLAVVLLCVLALSGCAGNNPKTKSEPHSHAYASWWMADLNNHWHSCEADDSCQDPGDLGSHDFVDGSCVVCDAVLLDDHSRSVEIHDEYGNPIYSASCYHDGGLISYGRYAYEYYDDGEIKKLTSYAGNDLRYEKFLRPCEDQQIGGYYVYQTIDYDIHQGYDITIYNEKGDILENVGYDADGNVIDVLKFEYEYNEKGECVCRWMYRDGALSRIERYEYYDSGVYAYSEITEFDALGREQYVGVTEKDKNGNDIKTTYTYYGVLAGVDEYKSVNSYTSYCNKSVIYRNEGSVEAIFYYTWDTGSGGSYLNKVEFYDRTGRKIQVVYYDREGKIILIN